MRNVAVVMVLIAFCGTLYAETRSAEINVSATVVARAKLTMDTHPLEIAIGADDLSRGYVDVPVVVRAVTNSPRGFQLSFTRDADLFDGVIARTGEALVNLSRGEGWLDWPYDGKAPRDIAINYRLQLGSRIAAGVYRFPVAVAIAPR